MHFSIDAAIISFLIDDEPIRAGFDNRDIIVDFHRANLDGNRRKIWRERANAIGKIIAIHKFWVLASDEKDLPESLACEMLSFRDDFIDIERDAKDRIVTRETAITTVVNAFVGKIQRREQTHRPSKIL